MNEQAGEADNVAMGFTHVLANDVASIAPLAARLAAFGVGQSIDRRVVEHLTLALDELLTNVIEHGFADDKPHELRVRIWLEDSSLQAELIDDAAPFDPFRDAPKPDIAADAQARPIGGLGVHFVRTLIDNATYQRADGRNILRIGKRLAG